VTILDNRTALVFWDVHDPDKAVGIELRDERYARLVIEVADPRRRSAGSPKPFQPPGAERTPWSLLAIRGRALQGAWP